MPTTLVYTADNILQVGLMRSLLEQNGIASELRNQHSNTLLGEVPYTSTWPELWVAESHAENAKGLIETALSRPISDTEWICRACNEQNPAGFDICWQCQTARSAEGASA